MIPDVEVFGEPKVPKRARFWEPQLTEYDDEGIGFFRDVWTIIDVTPAEATAMIERERILLQAVDALADTAEQFDQLAYFAEWWDLDKSAGLNGNSPTDVTVLESTLQALEPNPLENLELGVAGLVYALAATGVVTAASCRGHVRERAWSEAPVVFFAASEPKAKALEPLVNAAQRVFTTDATHPELLIIAGASITRTTALARAILSEFELNHDDAARSAGPAI